MIYQLGIVLYLGNVCQIFDEEFYEEACSLFAVEILLKQRYSIKFEPVSEVVYLLFGSLYSVRYVKRLVC